MTIVHLGGLGDLVVSLPVLDVVRAGWPAVAVRFIGTVAGGDVVSLTTGEVVCSDIWGEPQRGLIARVGSAPPASMGPCDLIIDLWACGTRAEHFAAVTGGEYLAMPPHPGSVESGDMTKRTWRWACSALGLGVTYRQPELSPGADRVADVAAYLAGRGVHVPYAVISPGAGATYKCWPLDGFAEVGRRLKADLNIGRVWQLGPREVGRDVVVPPDAADYVAREWGVADVAALVANAAVYVGTDSGISHVAAWTCGRDGRRTPAVILYARLNLAAWASRSGWVTTLAMPTQEPAALARDDVLAAVKGRLR